MSEDFVKLVEKRGMSMVSVDTPNKVVAGSGIGVSEMLSIHVLYCGASGRSGPEMR